MNQHDIAQAVNGTDALNQVLGVAAKHDLQHRLSGCLQTHNLDTIATWPEAQPVPAVAVRYLRLIVGGMYPYTLPEWLRLIAEERYQPQFEVIKLLTQPFLNAWKLFLIRSVGDVLKIHDLEIVHTLIDTSDAHEDIRLVALSLLGIVKEGDKQETKSEEMAFNALPNPQNSFRIISPMLPKYQAWTPTLTQQYLNRCWYKNDVDTLTFTEKIPEFAPNFALSVASIPIEVRLNEFIEAIPEIVYGNDIMWKRMRKDAIRALCIIKFRRQMIAAIESGA